MEHVGLEHAVLVEDALAHVERGGGRRKGGGEGDRGQLSFLTTANTKYPKKSHCSIEDKKSRPSRVLQAEEQALLVAMAGGRGGGGGEVDKGGGEQQVGQGDPHCQLQAPRPSRPNSQHLDIGSYYMCCVAAQFD